MAISNKLSKKQLFFHILLFALLYTFFYVFSLHVLPAIFFDDEWIVQTLFSFSIAISLFTVILLKKTLTLNSVYKFSFIALFLTILLIVTPFFLLNLLYVFIIGAFFGVAQVAFLTSFWFTYGSNDERGRISGIIVFFSMPIYFVISTLLASDLDLFNIIILTSGLTVAIALLASRIKKPNYKQNDSRGSHPEKRTIFLYLLPWIVFSIINATLARNITINILQFASYSFYLAIAILQIIGSLIGALTGGIMADYLGRRSTLAISITLSGISLALSGLTQNEAVLYFAYVASGLGWGVLLTLYIFVVWGDLSNTKNATSMYSLGIITFYATAGIGYLTPFIDQIPLITSALLGCFIIFFLNMPIALAPELASFDYREKIRFRKYMKKARKIESEMKNQTS